MLDSFYDLLASRISPDLIVEPTTQEKADALNSIAGKEEISLLNSTRSMERKKKNKQRRSAMSRNTPLLKRTPDLTAPNSPIVKSVVKGSLLGNMKDE